MPAPGPPEEFVSEPIVPAPGSFDATAMSRGEAGCPHRFSWRGRELVVEQLLSTWKSSTADRGEMYLRRHWFAVRTTTGERMTLYCDRQAHNSKRPKSRWWVYSVAAAPRGALAPSPPAPPQSGSGSDSTGASTEPSR